MDPASSGLPGLPAARRHDDGLPERLSGPRDTGREPRDAVPQSRHDRQRRKRAREVLDSLAVKGPIDHVSVKSMSGGQRAMPRRRAGAALGRRHRHPRRNDRSAWRAAKPNRCSRSSATCATTTSASSSVSHNLQQLMDVADRHSRDASRRTNRHAHGQGHQCPNRHSRATRVYRSMRRPCFRNPGLNR